MWESERTEGVTELGCDWSNHGSFGDGGGIGDSSSLTVAIELYAIGRGMFIDNCVVETCHANWTTEETFCSEVSRSRRHRWVSLFKQRARLIIFTTNGKPIPVSK
jgi:hypothetical protein